MCNPSINKSTAYLYNARSNNNIPAASQAAGYECDCGETERRRYRRYKIGSPAEIISLIYDNQAYTLYKPFQVIIADISKGGVRIRAVYNALQIGCKFEICFRIGKKREQVQAEVVNVSDNENVSSEYGCRLYARNTLRKRISI